MEKTLNSAGIHWKSPEHGSSIPAGKFLNFSGTFRSSSCAFSQGTGRKSPEKLRKFSCWNTSSMFRCSLAGTVPYFLIWDAHRLKNVSFNRRTVDSQESQLHHPLSPM